MNTPQELRKKFLEKAEPIIDEYIGAALGTSELKSTNSTARSEVWDLMKDIISKADDLKSIEAGTANDLIGLLKDGKITLSEAKELMQIMSSKFEMEEVASIQRMLASFQQNRIG